MKRSPPPNDPWLLLKERHVKADELLAQGFTFHELAARGATLEELLQRLSFDDVLKLGATYETLLASDLAESIERLSAVPPSAVSEGERAFLVKVFSFTTLPNLIRDGVIRRASTIAALKLRPSELAKYGVTAPLLFDVLKMDVATLGTFCFSLVEWVQQLGLQPQHLISINFSPERELPRGWTLADTVAFLKTGSQPRRF